MPQVHSDSFRTIIIVFVMAVVIIALLAIFFALPSAQLAIATSEKSQQRELEIQVSELGDHKKLKAAFWEDTAEATREFSASGDTVEQEGKAHGNIEIVNNSSSDQTLVATTRFLTPDNVLLRLDRQVVIPRRSQIVAPATAQEPGRSGNVTAGTKLSIPGLSASRQEQVYGLAPATLAGGVITRGAVKPQDLEKAKLDLTTKLREMAEVNFLAQLIEKQADSADNSIATPALLSQQETLLEQASAQEGEEVDSFTYSLSLKTRGIAYQQKALDELVRSELINSLAAGNALQNIKATKVEIKELDTEQKQASLQVKIEFESLLTDTRAVLEDIDLGGLSESEVRAFFESTSGLELRSIELSPFWVKRIPRNSSRVTLMLEE